MMYELWATADKKSLTFTGSDSVEDYKQQGVIEPDAERIWRVEADSWNEAAALYYKFMGWEPYKSMDE